ncbi:MAG: LppM family (lipo)protein, partial [Acidimicrobiia bacterium]
MRRFLVIASLAIALSACEVRTHLLVDANDLSNGTITAVVGFDEEFRNLIAESGEQGDILAELESTAEAEGWEAAPFVDGDVEGYQVSHGYSSIEELQELISSSMLTAEWGFTDISFKEDEGDFVFEMSGGNPMSELSGEAGFEGMEDLLTIDFQIAVTFPGPVQEHNGDLEARTV